MLTMIVCPKTFQVWCRGHCSSVTARQPLRNELVPYVSAADFSSRVSASRGTASASEAGGCTSQSAGAVEGESVTFILFTLPVVSQPHGVAERTAWAPATQACQAVPDMTAGEPLTCPFASVTAPAKHPAQDCGRGRGSSTGTARN